MSFLLLPSETPTALQNLSSEYATINAYNLLFFPDMVFGGRGSREEPDRLKAAQKMHSAIQLCIAFNSFLT